MASGTDLLEVGAVCQEAGADTLWAVVEHSQYICSSILSPDRRSLTLTVTDGIDSAWQLRFESGKRLAAHRSRTQHKSWKAYFETITTGFEQGSVQARLSGSTMALTISGSATQGELGFELPIVVEGRLKAIVRDLIFVIADSSSLATIVEYKRRLDSGEPRTTSSSLTLHGSQSQASSSEDHTRKRARVGSKAKKAYENKINPSQPRRRPATGVMFGGGDDDTDSD